MNTLEKLDLRYTALNRSGAIAVEFPRDSNITFEFKILNDSSSLSSDDAMENLLDASIVDLALSESSPAETLLWEDFKKQLGL